MKKTLMLAAAIAAVAMLSHGGNTLLAHAQTANTSTATLQQQLDNAKAELVQLQMQAGEIPAGDAGAPGTSAQSTTTTAMPAAMPTVTLSASEIAQMNGALTALANLLITLQSQMAQNPQFATTHGPVVVSALKGIATTIALIGNDVTGSHVAMTMPASQAAGNTGSTGVAMTTPTTPAAPAPASAPAASQPSQIAQTSPAQTAPTTPTAPVTPAPQTAQASSSFSFSKLNWPLIIVIILIIAAIAIWLWWDDSDDTKKQPVVVKSGSPASQRPMQTSTQVSTNSTTQVQSVNRQTTSTQTPLSSAVAPQGGNR